jgi:hypothetical protein
LSELGEVFAEHLTVSRLDVLFGSVEVLVRELFIIHGDGVSLLVAAIVQDVEAGATHYEAESDEEEDDTDRLLVAVNKFNHGKTPARNTVRAKVVQRS